MPEIKVHLYLTELFGCRRVVVGVPVHDVKSPDSVDHAACAGVLFGVCVLKLLTNSWNSNNSNELEHWIHLGKQEKIRILTNIRIQWKFEFGFGVVSFFILEQLHNLLETFKGWRLFILFNWTWQTALIQHS